MSPSHRRFPLRPRPPPRTQEAANPPLLEKAETAPTRSRLMAPLVWGMMGIALGHVAVFRGCHFWSGIVGAFVGAVIGALLFGFLVHGLTVPGQNDTDLMNALEAIPGAVAGMAVVYFKGLRDTAAAAVALREPR